MRRGLRWSRPSGRRALREGSCKRDTAASPRTKEKGASTHTGSTPESDTTTNDTRAGTLTLLSSSPVLLSGGEFPPFLSWVCLVLSSPRFVACSLLPFSEVLHLCLVVLPPCWVECCFSHLLSMPRVPFPCEVATQPNIIVDGFCGCRGRVKSNGRSRARSERLASTTCSPRVAQRRQRNVWLLCCAV